MPRKPQPEPRSNPDYEVLPVVEERVRVEKDVRETGRVRVRVIPEEREVFLREMLERRDVTVERTPVNRRIEAIPEVRQEKDGIVIPVVEEEAVVVRRLVLKEEVRVRFKRSHTPFEEVVTVAGQRVEIERAPVKPNGEPT